MPDKRLVAVVTALMMSVAALGARGQATIEQLETIDRLLSEGNTRALWAYMQQYPGLLAGEDELSLELRKFCNDVTSGRLSCHYEPPSAATEATRSGTTAAAAPASAITAGSSGLGATRTSTLADDAPY